MFSQNIYNHIHNSIKFGLGVQKIFEKKNNKISGPHLRVSKNPQKLEFGKIKNMGQIII